MSEKEFLARWSRRKQEARATPAAEKAESSHAAPASPPPEMPVAEPEIDLSLLPPIDSITAMTDITAFLRKGIPPELSRAALRRAWSSDPAIRDFVGLAENAWDFNDPNAMPGFGPLNCSEEELKVLLDRVIGGLHRTAENDASEHPESNESRPVVPLQEPESEPAALDRVIDPGGPNVVRAVAPHTEAEGLQEGPIEPVRRRMHGGALPRDTD
jgi:hypothetical protein